MRTHAVSLAMKFESSTSFSHMYGRLFSASPPQVVLTSFSREPRPLWLLPQRTEIWFGIGDASYHLLTRRDRRNQFRGLQSEWEYKGVRLVQPRSSRDFRIVLGVQCSLPPNGFRKQPSKHFIAARFLDCV